MNPFKYGKIVSGNYFYDRKSELARIKSPFQYPQLKGTNGNM